MAKRKPKPKIPQAETIYEAIVSQKYKNVYFTEGDFNGQPCFYVVEDDDDGHVKPIALILDDETRSYLNELTEAAGDAFSVDDDDDEDEDAEDEDEGETFRS